MSKPFAVDSIYLGGAAGVYLLQGAAAPTAGVVAPLDSLYWQTSTSLIWQKTGTADTAWVPLLPQAMYGDASDGTATINAGTTTLARDTYYDDLNIGSTGVLVTRGFRIFVRGTLSSAAGCVISAIGGDGAAAGTAGIGQPTAAGTVGAIGALGGAGGVAAGNAGGASGSAIQGFAGAGGAGGTGTAGAGGAAGAVTTQAATAQGNPRSLTQAMIGSQVGGAAVARITTGAGGGGGGGDATAGGGGGGGGGFISIMARVIANLGSISANGGAGGTPAAGNRGGGGGGGGGLVVYGTHAFSGNAPTVAAGVHGNGSGTGTAGADGSAGLVIGLQF